MRIQTLGVVAAAAVTIQAGAMDFIDVAPVVAVTPLYGPVSDGRDCFVAPPPQPAPTGAAPAIAPQAAAGSPQPAPPPQQRSVIAPIAGGVAGALLGSQVGQGRGREAATAVGAVGGTLVADRVANPNSGGSITGAVVGGGAGALIGSQVGRGTGQTAATAVGAIGGAMVGDRIMSTPPSPQPVQAVRPVTPAPQEVAAPPQAPIDRCRTVDGSTREILRGYSVVYRYNGRDITTTVPNHPGNSIRIAIGALDNVPPPPAAPAGAAPVGNPAGTQAAGR